MQSRALVRGTFVLGGLCAGLCVPNIALAAARVEECRVPGGEAGGTTDSGDPGALIEVTLQGRVGVVLDEIPAGLRGPAALYYLLRPRQFWRDRASQQLLHTSYRLTYRPFYYDEAEAKGILALPPRQLWRIELNDLLPARVTTPDGHDALVMRYTLRTTLLSDTDSPGEAEPALADVGGVWEEPFSLPLDPEFVFQRTGYACMDEDGYPLRTAESENEAALYDHECGVETPDEPTCHYSEFPDESCVEALERAIGRMDAPLRFERIAYDDRLADEVRISTYTRDEAPDLAVIPEGLQNNRIVYRYIEPDSCAIEEACVTGSGWRRLLEYDASIRNESPAELVIGEVSEESPFVQHNVFEFSACHEHYHYSHYGEFSYGALPGDKRAFCIESTDRYFNSEETPITHPFGCDNQGIASGWGDTYIAGIECNWIDITNLAVPPGGTTQTLEFDLNPDDFICEGTPVTDEDGEQVFVPTGEIGENGELIDRPLCDFVPGYDANNLGQLGVTVPRDGGLITAPCTRNQAGPLKDCGFQEQAENLSCTPGEEVTLRCRVPGLLAGPQVLRVCENSAELGGVIACMYREALTTAIVGNQNTLVSFTCPEARGADEPGGTFGYYRAPVLPTQSGAPIQCTRVP